MKLRREGETERVEAEAENSCERSKWMGYRTENDGKNQMSSERVRTAQSKDIVARVHDRRIGSDRTANRRVRLFHLDDHHSRRSGGNGTGLTNADEFGRLHGDIGEANIVWADAQGRQLML
jgi:hypothetical protein